MKQPLSGKPKVQSNDLGGFGLSGIGMSIHNNKMKTNQKQLPPIAPMATHQTPNQKPTFIDSGVNHFGTNSV